MYKQPKVNKKIQLKQKSVLIYTFLMIFPSR
jgi:hypothetical protein